MTSGERQVWTPIHRELGRMGQPLDYALMQACVAEAVPEQSDLDWKRGYTQDAEELAKDIAAMANSGGGVIVYGVAEDKRTSAATGLPGVELVEGNQRHFRQVAGSSIRPPVFGLELVAIPDPSTPGQGLLAAIVAASVNAPHFLTSRSKGRLVAPPVRVGAQTQYLEEPEIERAYRRRFDAARQVEERLVRLEAGVLSRTTPGQSQWCVGVCTPMQLAVHYPRLTPQQITDASIGALETIDRQWRERSRLLHSTGGIRTSTVGLRSRIFQGRNGEVPIICEIHDDGSCVIAAGLLGTDHDLELAEAVVMDLLALADAAQTTVKRAGTAAIRITVSQRTPSIHDHVVVPGQVAGGMFVPVLAEVDLPTDSYPRLRRDGIEIARDVVNQFGADYLSLFE